MHTDPEIVALHALGERGAATPDQIAHLESCAACRDECTSLREIADLARTVSDHLTIETPPPAVWDRIRAELGLAADLTSGSVPPPWAADSGQRGRAHLGVVRPAADDSGSVADEPAAGSASSWTGRRLATLALVAVLALIVGIGGTLLLQSWTAPRDTVLTTTELAALPNWAGSTGEAELEVDPEGRRWLVVRVDPVRPVDGFEQVWLINTDVTAMLQVGLLSYSGQRFLLPDEVDVSRYPVVDVSDEPATDDGAHSGNSIVRGTLRP